MTQQKIDQCPHCGWSVDDRHHCVNCGQSFAALSRTDARADPTTTGSSTTTNRGMSRRKLLAFGGGAAAVLGTLGIGVLVVPSDDQSESGDQFGFGLVASDSAAIETKLDGTVQRNALSGYDVLDHVGAVRQDGQVVAAVRIRNVGEESPRVLAQHSFTSVLYDTDGDELTRFGPVGAGTSIIRPDETTVVNYLGPNTDRFEDAELGRYGLVLDCAAVDEDNRSSYCPSS
jgi:hypothetical protein